MRRGAGGKRRDQTERDIVEGLRAMGAFVVQLNGDGIPDLLVYWKYQWLPIEVKTKKGKVRPNQTQYPVARSLDEALALFR